MLARNGERVRLEHSRVGGKIFTTEQWLSEFGRALSLADTRYFEAKDQEDLNAPPRSGRYGPGPREGRARKDRALTDDVAAELDAEGI